MRQRRMRSRIERASSDEFVPKVGPLKPKIHRQRTGLRRRLLHDREHLQGVFALLIDASLGKPFAELQHLPRRKTLCLRSFKKSRPSAMRKERGLGEGL